MESGRGEEDSEVDRTPLKNSVAGYDYQLFQTQLVATRRLQWDLLLWQAPTLALTGQAFLFSIALGGGRSQFSKIVAASLLVLISLSSLHTLSGHRLSELTDSQIIQKFEEDNGLPRMFGVAWRDRRKELVLAQRQLPWRRVLIDRCVAHVMRVRSITVWFLTMSAMLAVSCLVLIVACVAPRLL